MYKQRKHVKYEFKSHIQLDLPLIPYTLTQPPSLHRPRPPPTTVGPGLVGSLRSISFLVSPFLLFYLFTSTRRERQQAARANCHSDRERQRFAVLLLLVLLRPLQQQFLADAAQPLTAGAGFACMLVASLPLPLWTGGVLLSGSCGP